MTVITEQVFKDRVAEKLALFQTHKPDGVTGSGRAGAIAAVYASYFLGVSFIPFGQRYYGKKTKGKKILLLGIGDCSERAIQRAIGMAGPDGGFIENVALFPDEEDLTFWYQQA